MRLPSRRWIGAFLSLSLASCDHPGPLGVPSAALDAVTDARCARAQRCKEIGPGLAYTSRNDCVLSTRAEWSEELNRIDCKRGVREDALNTCLRELSEAGCGGEGMRGACRPLAICDPLPQPPPVPLARDPAVPG
jgi:hypothetical protein